MKYIPVALITFRIFLAPIIIGLSYYMREESRFYILIFIYLGIISDAFDGIIARYLNISTSSLRRFDSQADAVFWLSVGLTSWILNPVLISNNKVPIILIFIMEGLCYSISFIKFKREPCTHAFLSKLWGVTLLIAFTSLIGFNYAGVPFYIAIIFGFISQIDVILIILILPKWTHDIPSCYHAFLIKKGKEFKTIRLLN